jgi:LuxR family maltose regulon positive regulatory protein
VHYRQVLEIVARTNDDPRVRSITVHTYGALADLELRQGHLRAAASFWARALAIVQDRDNQGKFPLPVTGWIYLRLGELAYERNDVGLGRDYLDRGIERANLGGEPRAMIAGRAIAARLALTDGDLATAETLLDEAVTLLESASFPDWAGRIVRIQVDLWLAQGRRRTAIDWATTTRETIDAGKPADETELAVARVLVDAATPDALDTTSRLLDQIIERAASHGLDGVQIEAHALRAIVRDRRGNIPGMLTDLETAFRIAEAEGFARTLVDLGYPMLKVLREAARRNVMAGYVAFLLAVFGENPPGGKPYPAGTLSSREVEVLQLLAAGLSNREIAGELFVSTETVKKHTASIYGKLGVGGRVEAVSRAKSLSLID